MRPNGIKFWHNKGCHMTDTSAKDYTIWSQISGEKHFLMPSQNRLSLKERLS
jgi:hypothetical protein